MKKNLYGKIILPVLILALMFMPGCGCGGGGGGSDDGIHTSVSVGTQSEIITEGVAGTVTFTVTTENIADNTYFAAVNNLPEDVTVQGDVIITAGSGELTLACGTSTVADTTDNLTLTIDGVTSEPFSLIIIEAGAKAVLIHEQIDTVNAGTAGAVTFLVSTLNIANDESGALTWYSDAAGTTSASSPAGVTPSGFSVHDNGSSLTINTTAAAAQGTYYFRVTFDNTESSNAAAFTILPPKTVTVGAQSGMLYEGVAGTVTFHVTAAYIADGSYTVTVANQPGGVTVSGQVIINSGSGTLTLSCSTSIVEGATNTLTLTIDGVTSAAFTLTIAGTGDGSPADPFIVGNLTALQKVGTGTDGWTMSVCYKQVAGIDLISVGSWTPIGSSSNRFTGSYDGDGWTISNLKITGSVDNQGLFGYISGTVKNVKLAGVNIACSKNVGGVAGYNDFGGKVQNCSAAGSINGSQNVGGGVVGYNYINAVVENCYAACDVEGSNLTIGGVVGDNSGMVQNCYSAGDVSGSNGYYIGGVVGENQITGTVQNCYAAGSVSAYSNAGGVVGWNNNGGNVKNCAALNNNVEIGLNVANIGRVIGQASGTMTNNYGGSSIILTYDNDNTPLPYTPISGANLKDGASADAGTDSNQYNNQDFWRDIVHFSFGSSDINPWKWVGSGTGAHPELYWQ